MAATHLVDVPAVGNAVLQRLAKARGYLDVHVVKVSGEVQALGKAYGFAREMGVMGQMCRPAERKM